MSQLERTVLNLEKAAEADCREIDRLREINRLLLEALERIVAVWDDPDLTMADLGDLMRSAYMATVKTAIMKARSQQ